MNVKINNEVLLDDKKTIEINDFKNLILLYNGEIYNQFESFSFF